jgi:hypothetical protein
LQVRDDAVQALDRGQRNAVSIAAVDVPIALANIEAALKSCAMGPICRMDGSCVFMFQVVSGKAATRRAPRECQPE